MKGRAVAAALLSGRLQRYGIAGLRIVALAAAYFGAAKLGLLEQLVRGVVTPLWPPTGIALAALLLLGPRIWPAIAIGAFAVNATLGLPAVAVVVIVIGNTLAPLCSYALLRRVGFRIEVDRLQDALALVFLGALAGMLISATLGSGILVLSGVLPANGFLPAWSVWWTGDATGVLIVTPGLLALRAARLPGGVRPRRWVEAAALLMGTLGIGYLATRTSNLLFLVFPFLVWAAFRFQRAGAAPCALAVSTLAILAATRMTGPFAGHNLFTNMVTLQAFDGATALTALLLAAVVTERKKTRWEIEAACARLSDVVSRLPPDLIERRRPPPSPPPVPGAR
ncbi:MASE1 domain-containing protein [Streptomyces sp. RB6PN25]|uniref:MASE1 domain-containing protein n=1 Tax=Streptomyces humicola TaxID=2953240 RepID=A0ABT1PUI4_9ACTN|nr:MASE1 domain-containing protein [Streptomyces humicola]MCQ4081334.1 MASE1 domain-containing protein [Streptomyces humicola]